LILTASQTRRLRNGELSALDFPFDPKCPDHGRPRECCVVLDWEPERRLWDETAEQVVTVPRQPLMWVEVTAINRHRKGHWRVQLSVTDLRHKPLYLGSGGTYTTSRFRAIDELEVVPRKDLERFAKVAYLRDQPRRLERVKADQAARWKHKRARRKSMDRFRPAA